ncbi:MAG: TetR/AcrR family transcriptional regulator C-terminal domain-containing protein [Acutalibacteraceae bacterium]|nr:TetR/AcrR family transcriptional regulator C-terminal domain-containing protein [Acutalibacteraceae bacterium]
MSQRTEKAIAASFKNLLQRKSLNKITISDITNDCGINRMTFYYHFRDIYDLIEWICDEDCKAAVEGNRSLDNWTVGLKNFMDVLYEDRSFILSAFHSVEREKIDEYLHKVLSGLILDAINGVESSRFVSEEDRKFIADYYTFAFSGLLEQWISSGMPDTREKMVSNIITIAQGSIKSSLEKFEDRESV